MFKFLLPKDEYFFEQFDKMAVCLVEGAQMLNQILEIDIQSTPEPRFNELALQLKTIEHQSDNIAYQIMAKLHKTFVTPLGREDMFHLVGRLDDVLDLTEGASSRIALYQPKIIPSESRQLGQVLLQSTKLVQEMVGLLHNMKNQARIMELTEEISRLEDQGDFYRRSTLARLFQEEKDVFELIKWKDIQEYIEKATDRCEDVADVVEGIVIEST